MSSYKACPTNKHMKIRGTHGNNLEIPVLYNNELKRKNENKRMFVTYLQKSKLADFFFSDFLDPFFLLAASPVLTGLASAFIGVASVTFGVFSVLFAVSLTLFESMSFLILFNNETSSYIKRKVTTVL